MLDRVSTKPANAAPKPGRPAKRKKAPVWPRDPLDWYVEPEIVTDELLRLERFVGPIWDPACGGGNILRACMRAQLDCSGTDVKRRIADDLGHVFAGEFDFLTADASARTGRNKNLPFPAWRATNILFNPPYFRAKGTEAFIRQALRVASGKVAAFAGAGFLASQDRGQGLFAEHCPHRVWHISKRPSCPPGAFLEAGNKAGSGAIDYVWMVWDLTAPPVTSYQGGWLRGAPGDVGV